ncbi:hypothetical protein [Marinicrinis lubricantis]|uniref:Uncharacterized protein n=1 Tax=Marinicrinis lubricantis TaxID=2086470 RepID=A0ABW1IM66_9BACL
MKWLKLAASTFLPAIAAAVVLTFVMNWGSFDLKGWGAKGQEELTEENLVDRMLELQLANPLTKVSWNHHILSIDLEWDSGNSGLLETLGDLKKIAAFSFERTNNAGQVLVRVLQRGEPPRLLVAMDVKREQWSELNGSQESAEQLWHELDKRTNLLMTGIGKHHFMKTQEKVEDSHL